MKTVCHRKPHSLVDSVYTLPSVYTWIAVTLVDVGCTDVVVIATRTVTLETVHLVDAGASVETRRRLTLIDVYLTETAWK